MHDIGASGTMLNANFSALNSSRVCTKLGKCFQWGVLYHLWPLLGCISQCAQGAAASQPAAIAGLRWRLFDFGRVDAEVAQAKGASAEALANYRKAMLHATEDVENAIIALPQLELQSKNLATEVDAHARALKCSRKTACCWPHATSRRACAPTTPAPPWQPSARWVAAGERRRRVHASAGQPSLTCATRPPPSRLRSVSEPPIASASWCAMASPSPLPPVSRLRDLLQANKRLQHGLETVFRDAGAAVQHVDDHGVTVAAHAPLRRT